MRDIHTFVRRYYRCIALVAVGFVACAAVYIAVTPPTYLATAEIIIDTNRAPVILQDIRPDVMTDQARVENEIEIIKSDRVAYIVISELALDQDPEFAGRPASLRDRLSPLLSWLLPHDGEHSAAQDRDARIRRRLVAIRFGERLGVRRIGQSFVIELAFWSKSPETAARVATAVAEAYVHENVAVKSQLAQRRGEWLSERLQSLQRQSFEAARAVERFKLLGDAGPDADVRAKLAELESVSQSYRRMYDGFLQQYAETVQKVSYPEPDARIVSLASVPLSKSYPKSTLILLFALCLGAAAGVAGGLVHTITDRSIRSPQRLRSDVGLECLGALSGVDAPTSSSRRRWWRPKERWEAADTVKAGQTLQAAIGDGASAVTADLRELRISIDAMTPARRPRCLGIVAPTEAEGTTTVAVGLANLCAFSGARTLLVDAGSDDGVTERARHAGVLESLESIRVCTELFADHSNLPFSRLRLGFDHPTVTTGGRSKPKRAASQLDELRKHFDVVVFDLPALSTSADARSVALYLDAMILVADFGKNSLDAISDAAACLHAARGNVLGVVLNRVPPGVRRGWRP